MKTKLLIGLTVVLVCTVAGVMLIKRETSRPVDPPTRIHQPNLGVKPDPPAPTPAAEVVEHLPPEPIPPAITDPPRPQSIKPDKPALTQTPTTSASTRADPASNPADQSMPLPVARLALYCAGTDPLANEVWAMAINDPNCSAHDRSDLIEDLNEEGFEDPKNLTADDLPLILNRLELIEEHVPYAMDQVNADAFMEAYKDLVNMAMRVLAQ